eukprot:2124656-Heterocapsa_arctica.AAC.2
MRTLAIPGRSAVSTRPGVDEEWSERRSSTRPRRRRTATRSCPRHRLRWTRSAPKPTRTTCRPRPTTPTAHGTSGRRKDSDLSSVNKVLTVLRDYYGARPRA